MYAEEATSLPQTYPQANAPRPADIQSIRGQFEDSLNALREINFRVRSFGDLIHGSRPEAVATGSAKDRPPLSFAELSAEIASEVSAIHVALNRL